MLRNKRWAFPVIPALAVTLTGSLALPGKVLRAQVRRDFSASLSNARQSASKSDSVFKFTTIDVPGSQASRAMGINAQGTVVGSFDDDNGTHGFIFDGRKYTTIDVPGSPSTQPKCINSRGEIVGFYADSDFNLHGFYWFRGKFRFIDVPNSTETRSEGITNAGLISGEYVDQDDNEHGYLLQGDTFQTIDVPNTFTTDIWMVSNDGWLTGDYSSATTVLAYVRTDRGVYLTLDYPGAVADSARAINDRHEVVGRWDDDSLVPDQIPCITQCHGFWWSKGEFRDIDFPGAIYTVALGINDPGVIVGRYVDADGNERGFIARSSNGSEADNKNEVSGQTVSNGQQE